MSVSSVLCQVLGRLPFDRECNLHLHVGGYAYFYGCSWLVGLLGRCLRRVADFCFGFAEALFSSNDLPNESLLRTRTFGVEPFHNALEPTDSLEESVSLLALAFF